MADGNKVKVESEADLNAIFEEIKKLNGMMDKVQENFKNAADDVEKNVKENTKQSVTMMERLRDTGRRVASTLKDDFKNLFALNQLVSGFKLNEQFRGAVSEAVNLSDTIRKMAPIFGLSQAAAQKFQSRMVTGLGQIGISSEAAANALMGLGETGVRGEENLLAYSKTASQLASITGQRGQEGGIAKGLAGAIGARGGNIQDVGELQRTANDVVKIRNATGKSATEALNMLSDLFSSANVDFRKRLQKGGSTTLATAGLFAGPQGVAFLKRFLGLDKIARTAFEAQGLGDIITEKGGLNEDAINKAITEANRRTPGNVQRGLMTMGLSEEEAKGFMLLSEALKNNKDAIMKAKDSVVDINQEFKDTMGLGDAFRANINKVKGAVSTGLEGIGIEGLTQKITGALAGASQEETGLAAGGVVAGGATLAAILASGGLKGLGKGLLGGVTGEIKAKGYEALTGEKVQKVEVINWPTDFGGAAGAAAGAGGMLGKAGKALGAVGAVGGAATLGYTAGTALNEVIEKNTQGTTEGGEFTGNAVERLIFAIEKLAGTDRAKSIQEGAKVGKQEVTVKIQNNVSGLRATPQPSRGRAQ